SGSCAEPRPRRSMASRFPSRRASAACSSPREPRFSPMSPDDPVPAAPSRLDRSKIGTKVTNLFYDVEAGQLRFFARTIGETDPVYFDEAAARAAGYRSIIAPPTFGFSCLRGSGDQMPFMTAMGLGEDHL